MTNGEKIDALEAAQTITADKAAAARRLISRDTRKGGGLDAEFESFENVGGVFTVTCNRQARTAYTLDTNDESKTMWLEDL
jgi:hypothetical protein